MIWIPFKITSKKFIGIDVGTFAVKVVELSRSGERIKLENYGELKPGLLFKKSFRSFRKGSLFLSSNDISRSIKAILEETGIKTKETILSIPDFSSFFTSFELPSMSQEELAQAVRFEARQHIPIPLSEVTIDWQVINKKTLDKKSKLDILLVAVPNEVIYQYQEITKPLSFKSFSLEAETFALLRSLIKNQNKEKQICLIDIGAQSTLIAIGDKGVLKVRHSFDRFSGNEFTHVLAKALNIDHQEAEILKKEHGLTSNSREDVGKILSPLMDLILSEFKKISRHFYQVEKKQIQEIILAGSSALMPGLKEYFAEETKIEVSIADPFSDIFYPPILDDTLKEIGPSFAVATGLALRGLE